jgi:hypothetical protein
MRFQILSLSGGGRLGFGTISVLGHQEDHVGASLAFRLHLTVVTSISIPSRHDREGS